MSDGCPTVTLACNSDMKTRNKPSPKPKRGSRSLDRLVRRFHVHYELRGHSQRMIIEGEPLDVALAVKEALDDGANQIKIWQ